MRISAVCCFLLIACSATIALSKEFELPEDPSTPVIVYDSAGGFTPRPVNNDPVMQILSDGTVLLGNRFKEGEPVQAKISSDELQKLLAFMLEEKKFREITAKTIQEKSAAADKAKAKALGGNGIIFAPRIADAPTTVVKVNVDGKPHEAKHYALFFAVRQYKDVQELQNLHAIAQHLQQLDRKLRAADK